MQEDQVLFVQYLQHLMLINTFRGITLRQVLKQDQLPLLFQARDTLFKVAKVVEEHSARFQELHLKG